VSATVAATGGEIRFREAISQSWRHYRDWHRRLIVVSVLASIAALAEAGIVVIVAELAARALASSDTGATAPSSSILHASPGALVALGAILVLLRSGTDLLAGWLQSEVVASYDAGQRMRLLEAFERASWAQQTDARRGELLELAGTHLTQTRVAAKAFTDVIVSFVGFLVLLIGGVVTGGPVALVVLGIFAVVGLALIPVSRWTRRSARRVALTLPDFANHMSEAVDLAREVKAFDVTEGSIGRVGASVSSLRAAWRNFYLSQAFAPTIVQAALLAIVVIGLGVIVLADVSDTATYVAMVLLLYRAAQYGRSLQAASQVLVAASPFRERLDERVGGLEDARERSDGRAMPPMDWIGGHHLTFAYPGHPPVLRDVDFRLDAGELVGLVGSSGVGKTTLLNILLRLEVPGTGELAVNGEPAVDVAVSAWRQSIGFVPQEPVLLDASVEENVRFLRSLDDGAVLAALQAANVLTEMRALPGGLGFAVGERGSRLSVGQRQRVCIARALAGSPALLVLDEPTSALDPASELAVRDTLESLRGRVTVLVVAHRLETISVCDRVLRLDEGRLLEVEPRGYFERFA
jgi:ABC-type multidrug transport system fused ATPase/permease subunit